MTKRTRDVQEQIRVPAYGLYEQRGKEGREVEDWLQAESEITQQQAKTFSRIGFRSAETTVPRTRFSRGALV